MRSKKRNEGVKPRPPRRRLRQFQRGSNWLRAPPAATTAAQAPSISARQRFAAGRTGRTGKAAVQGFGARVEGVKGGGGLVETLAQ